MWRVQLYISVHSILHRHPRWGDSVRKSYLFRKSMPLLFNFNRDYSDRWYLTRQILPTLALAKQMYELWNFSAMPILADALQDAGCHNADILDHCRGPGPHVRGCWVVDLILSKDR